MKDLAMHIMDIVQNSTRAGANLVQVVVVEDTAKNHLSIQFIDDGCGMDKEMVQQVSNPFFTSRTTRKVGMGIPLLMQNAEQSNGSVNVESEVGKGTTLTAEFTHNHIDRPPWGDVSATMSLIISGNPDIEFIYQHKYNNQEFELDSRVIKQELDGLPIYQPEVIKFIKEMLQENLKAMGVEIE